MSARAAIILALALAGCGGGSTPESAARTGEISLENATVADVANQAAAAGGAMRFDPGQWETIVEMVEVSVPGMPAAMAQQMKGAMGAGNTTVTSCMTPQQAERPSEEMFAGNARNCRFDRYEMKGGRLDATMTCAGGPGGGGSAVVTMAGSYSATSFEMRNAVKAQGGAGQPAVNVSTRVTGRRLGACIG